MSGKRLIRIRKQISKHIIKGGSEENISLTTPNDVTTVDITGLATKHWINFDTDGRPVNSKNAHICISESQLTELGYPLRDVNEEIFLKSHKVKVSDSSGVVKDYIIREWYPSETLGVIVCILGDFE